ncbi:alcohol dehydrogenase, partial [Vibrio alginolyticus]|nr:alcohol dehydrogenase [Vibrio alginolyticus]MDW2199505.1 alcohol dehydrogenase [Vibrio sp. 2084]
MTHKNILFEGLLMARWIGSTFFNANHSNLLKVVVLGRKCMFQFMTATRIIFGEGALQSSLSVINQFGYSVLLVTGKETQ